MGVADGARLTGLCRYLAVGGRLDRVEGDWSHGDVPASCSILDSDRVRSTAPECSTNLLTRVEGLAAVDDAEVLIWEMHASAAA